MFVELVAYLDDMYMLDSDLCKNIFIKGAKYGNLEAMKFIHRLSQNKCYRFPIHAKDHLALKHATAGRYLRILEYLINL